MNNDVIKEIIKSSLPNSEKDNLIRSYQAKLISDDEIRNRIRQYDIEKRRRKLGIK